MLDVTTEHTLKYTPTRALLLHCSIQPEGASQSPQSAGATLSSLSMLCCG